MFENDPVSIHLRDVLSFLTQSARLANQHPSIDLCELDV
jgi:hypothetical protein